MDLPHEEGAPPSRTGAALDTAALATSPRVKPDGGYLPPMVSYAQNFEDVMLRRALQDIACGFYVDIGAADPDADSVTRWFYEQGWRGINVEPDPRYFRRLEERRPEDRNLRCVVGAVNGNVVFNVATPGGASTGSARRLAELTHRHRAATKPIVAPAVTLDQLLALSCGRVIDFLKIDAEDMEDDILGGASFVSQRPRIIVAEATRFNNQIPSHQAWEAELLGKGYRFAWFDGLNRFYVRHEDEWRLELFKVPPCVFDNFFATTIRARVDDIQKQAAEAAERYEAALSRANADANAARARAESIASELQQRTTEFERQKTELETRIEKLTERDSEFRYVYDQMAAAHKRADALRAALAQRESDCQRLRDDLARREDDLRRLQQDLAQRDEVCRELEDRLAQRNDDCRRLQGRVRELDGGRRQLLENLAQRESACRELEDSLAQRDEVCRELEESLARRDGEIARLIAERDKAAAQSLRWSGAAIPQDRDRLGGRRQYPVQARLYRRRWGRWLAVGLQRRRRILVAAARGARDRQYWELAARYYREALDLAPERPALWVQYGHALKEAGNLAAAEGAYRTALALDAGIADTHLQLGHVLKLQGRTAEAADAYRRALTLAPQSPHAMHELLALNAAVAEMPAADHAAKPSSEPAEESSADAEEEEGRAAADEDTPPEAEGEEPPQDPLRADKPDALPAADPRAAEIYRKLAARMRTDPVGER